MGKWGFENKKICKFCTENFWGFNLFISYTTPVKNKINFVSLLQKVMRILCSSWAVHK